MELCSKKYLQNIYQLIKMNLFIAKSSSSNITKITFIFSMLFIIFIRNIKENFIMNESSILISSNKHYIYNYFEDTSINNIYFNISNFKYSFSFKFKIISIEYKIAFYDNNKIIFPSDLKLYYNLSIICHIEIGHKKISIDSLPNIYQNKYYYCLDFFNINEKILIGIKIIKEIEEKLLNNTIYFFNGILYNIHNYIYKNDDIFNPLILNENYFSIVQKMYKKRINESLKLKKSYIKFPIFSLKRNALIKEDLWQFYNIYNKYFCFCKGINCLKIKVSKRCKYFSYLNIIDKNKNIYPKTDYLLIDFIFANLSSDDAFPVFKEMKKREMPAHYITEKVDIYNEYCKNKKDNSIILVNQENYIINGDFLEKYLTLFLKLKQVISGGGIFFNFINNIFFNIEYITYISITHGVCYFKYFLYKDYGCYSTRRIDKILLPPSEKIISLAKRYEWKDEDIIKINLPRWDKYNTNIQSLFNNKNISNPNSIFFLFTWRDIIKNQKISSYYFQNIFNLVKNKDLKNILQKNNITLFFSLHHLIDKYEKYRISINNIEYLKFIKQNEISDCLAKTNLVVSDFSSIVFDIMYRRKPFIIFIPDANDPKIEEIYKKTYFDLIKSMKNGTIDFENKYFDVNDTINKINYYINNNFKLDLRLKKFYDNFGIKRGNNTNEFIEYLKKL
jgi:CDP-glycerol glycerophosphotransferase (TagB/SpsB family)